jgi:DNA repair exonuclease SbcCD ATPase subunit
MILEAVTLTNWKSIPNVTVNLCEGINILYGPNEIGKSTLLEAVELGLTGEAHSTKAEYKALVPWNTKVKALVSLLLRNNNGKRYVINKSFPKGDAELFLVDDEAPSRTLIAEGREVNSAILEILGIEEDLESLITLLWIKQGEALNLFNSKPSAGTQIVTGGLKQKIERLIKERLTSPVAEEFYSRIKDEYDDYFLQSGKLKTARNSAGKRVSDLESVKSGMMEEISAIRERLAAVRSISENMQSLDTAIAEAETKLKTAETGKNQLAVKKKAWDGLERLRETYEPVRKTFSELVQINNRLEAIRAELPAAYAQKRVLIENRIKEIEERLGQYRDKKNQLEQLKKEASSFKPVEEKEIETVVELETKIKTLSVQLEKTQINLSITPEKTVNLVVRKDDEQARERAVSGPETLKINQSAEIVYPGHFSVEITGPLTEEAYERLSRQQREADRKREKILNHYGVENGKELRDYAGRYRELTGKISRLQDELSAFDPDRLGKEKAGFEQDVEKDSEQLELFAPQERGAATAEALQFTTLREIEQHITGLEQEDRHLSRRKKEILADMDYEEFETDVLLKKREIEEKTEQFRTLEPRDREEITETMIAEKERAVEKLRDRIASLKEEKAGMAGRLTGGEDLEERLSEREYRLRRATEELESEYRNSKAAALLLSLMDNAKQEREAETVGPVQERISSFFEELTEGKYQGFYVDKDFRPVTVDARTFDGSSVQFAPSLLSVGAQEQLSFLFRFALATRLAEEETQIMALDDSFVNTDPSRLAALFSLISSAKQRIQFLIFTCNEQNFEKFRSECTMIDLGRLVRRA